MAEDYPAHEGHRALRVIAAYKLLKATGLLIVAGAAFGLIVPAHLQEFSEWLVSLPLRHGHGFLVRLIERLFELGPRKFLAIGIAACVYAAVFLVEGWGLWREKRWAEYMTVIVTASLIPIELWEIYEHVTWLKIAAFLANVAIVIYLVYLLKRPRSVAEGSLPRATQARGELGP
jgi:uncharacterized membrane protein (DUF2068 family)